MAVGGNKFQKKSLFSINSEHPAFRATVVKAQAKELVIGVIGYAAGVHVAPPTVALGVAQNHAMVSDGPALTARAIEPKGCKAKIGCSAGRIIAAPSASFSIAYDHASVAHSPALRAVAVKPH